MVITASDTPVGTPVPAQILKAAGAIGLLASGADSTPRLMALLCDPSAEATAIAALIAGQPSMYARVLRVANSSYYGQSRSITTVERALMLLGRDAVRSIATATCFDRTMSRMSKGSVLDMQAVARHSLATAAAAESLAKIARPVMASEAFIGGLLHNLGVAIQVQLDPGGIEALIAANRQGAACGIREVEAKYTVVGHEECLAVVFAAWQMPETLVAIAAHHHAPMDAPEPQRDLAALVNLGSTMALATCPDYPLEPTSVAGTSSELTGSARRWLGLSDEQIDSVAAELPARVAELGAALHH